MPFHEAALKRLGHQVRFSPRLVQVLAQREEMLGVTLPAAVREWYSLEGAVAHLSRQDHPVPAEALELAGKSVQSPILIVMYENQGVCRWGISLDGTEDPPVLVEVEDVRQRRWLPFANRYSDFVLAQVWEWADGFPLHGSANAALPSMSAQEPVLADEDLALLRREFVSLPETFNWPGDFNYRFENALGKVMIWHGADQVDWFLSSPQEVKLYELTIRLWNCGTLASTLYGLDDTADLVLKSVRESR